MPVIRTICNKIFFVFVLNDVRFTTKKYPLGVMWPSDNTTKVFPRAAVEEEDYEDELIGVGQIVDWKSLQKRWVFDECKIE